MQVCPKRVRRTLPSSSPLSSPPPPTPAHSPIPTVLLRCLVEVRSHQVPEIKLSGQGQVQPRLPIPFVGLPPPRPCLPLKAQDGGDGGSLGAQRTRQAVYCPPMGLPGLGATAMITAVAQKSSGLFQDLQTGKSRTLENSYIFGFRDSIAWRRVSSPRCCWCLGPHHEFFVAGGAWQHRGFYPPDASRISTPNKL